MGINLRKTTELGPGRAAHGAWGPIPRRVRALEGVRGAVGAELGPEGVADLADGGELAEGLAHRGEEVVAGAGGVAEVREGGLDGLGVPGGADVDQRLGLGVGDG